MLYAVLLRYLMTLNVSDGVVFSIVEVDSGDRIYYIAFPIHFTRVIKKERTRL